MPPLSVFQLPTMVEADAFGEHAERQTRAIIGRVMARIVERFLLITIV
jgi:hypothetical protein